MSLHTLSPSSLSSSSLDGRTRQALHISTCCAPVGAVVVDGKEMEASMAAVEEVEGTEVI